MKEKIMEKIRNFFCKNLLLKIAAVLLSFSLWFIVATVDDPVDQKRFQNIKVNFVNTEFLDDQNRVFEILDETDVLKTVTFDAPKSVRDVIQPSDIIAEADLENITVTNTVEIRFSCPKYGVQVQNISGNIEYAKLNIEEKERKWLSIEAKTIGQVADGYVVGRVILGQNRLEIQGPKSAINQVKKAQVEINVADITEDISTSVQVKLLDENGQEVKRASVVKNIDTVMVEVTVLSTKEIPVYYEAGGEPADGYLLTGEIKAPIDSVVLAGPSKTLKNLNAIYIRDDILNVDDATKDVEITFDLRDRLPTGLSLADPSFEGVTTVTVGVEKVASKSLHLPQDNIRVEGMPEGVNYEWFDAAPFLVEVSGLNANVSVMTDRTTLGWIDVEKYMKESGNKVLEPGNIYTIPIEVNLLDKVKIDNEPKAIIRILEPEMD